MLFLELHLPCNPMTRSKNTDDVGPIQNLIKSLNNSLNDLGADFSVSATIDIPLRASIMGDQIFNTHIKVKVTENGWEIQTPERQVKRIKQEFREQLNQSS